MELGDFSYKQFYENLRASNFFGLWLRMLISFLNDVNIQLILKFKHSFGKYHSVCLKILKVLFLFISFLLKIKKKQFMLIKTWKRFGSFKQIINVVLKRSLISIFSMAIFRLPTYLFYMNLSILKSI